jgi:hypothetical protein
VQVSVIASVEVELEAASGSDLLVEYHDKEAHLISYPMCPMPALLLCSAVQVSVIVSVELELEAAINI